MKTLQTCVKELTTKVNKHETEAEKWKNLEDRISTIESKVFNDKISEFYGSAINEEIERIESSKVELKKGNKNSVRRNH